MKMNTREEESLAEEQREAFFNINLHRVVETTGCTFEDGGDNRESSIWFAFVPDSDIQEKSFGEHMNSLFENQDYSYHVDEEKVARFGWYEVKALKEALDKLVKNYPHLFDETCEESDNNE